MVGRRAVVVGGGSGIGLAVVELFLAEGAVVAVVDRDGDALSNASRALGAAFAAHQVDVTDSEQVDTAMPGLAAELGGIDCLVNSAAIRAYGAVADLPSQTWADVWRVNLLGAVNICHAVLPFLRREPDASIVNISSVYGLVGRGGMGPYDATKSALLALTRTLAVEEAPNGIRVNVVCPGSTLTPWTRRRAEMAGDDSTRANAGAALLDRWAESSEIAYPVLWLACHEASFVTGQVLVVDGGLSAV